DGLVAASRVRRCGNRPDGRDAEAHVTVTYIAPPGATREQRLRSRIDFLSDERDAALEALWDERTKNERLEERNERLMYDNKDLRRSRETWEERAVAAE